MFTDKLTYLRKMQGLQKVKGPQKDMALTRGNQEFLKAIADADLIRGNFNVKISRYVTNVDGQLINKSLLPANLQINYPYFLFGSFDSKGNYRIGHNELPVSPALFAQSFSYGADINFIYFSGSADILTKLNIGDQVLVYTDSFDAPNFFIWIIMAMDRQSYSSVIHNSDERPLTTEKIQFFSDNQDQFSEPIISVHVNPIGEYKKNQINPLAFKHPDYAGLNNQFIQLPIKKKLHQYFGMYSYLRFDTNQISMIFSVKY